MRLNQFCQTIPWTDNIFLKFQIKNLLFYVHLFEKIDTGQTGEKNG